jgi:hypothetical protein
MNFCAPLRLAVTIVVLTSLARTQSAGAPPVPRESAKRLIRSSDNPASTALTSVTSYGEIPLAFEPNLGQVSADVRFVARARELSVLLEDRRATLIASSGTANSSAERSVLGISLVGASWRAVPTADGRQEGVSNYLVGKDPSAWHTDIVNFTKVRYTDVYPGINLVFYGNHRKLEHDFQVASGVDYRQIRVRLEGAKSLAVQADGGLQVETNAGSFHFEAPEVYQEKGANRIAVKGHYAVVASNEFRFRLGKYDRSLPVVIDPVLSYSTYLAGSSTDFGTAIAVDQKGNAYVTGYTYSTDFPIKGTAAGTCATACSPVNAFVTKLNATGTALMYSTIVGGSGFDQANAIAVDALGNAVVVGSTGSFDFPQKNGVTAILSTYGNHGFAFSLTPAGTKLNFSTYLGGESQDSATGVALDATGSVYVSGYTSSANFPVTPGNQIGPPPGNIGSDLFLVKLARYGKFTFSTLVGGNSTNYGGPFSTQFPISVAVDSLGEAIVAGGATSGFPTTAGAYQTVWPGTTTGFTSGFIGKLNATGSSLVYGTYFGGSGGPSGGDGVGQIKVDAQDNLYLTGMAGSNDFPTTPGAFMTTHTGTLPVAFVTKMDATLTNLVYSTYVGGAGDFWYPGASGTGIAIDGNGNAAITGTTTQTDFPVVSPLQSQPPPGSFGGVASAVFLSVLNSSGSALTYSTLFSGSTGTQPGGVAMDINGDAYIAGMTSDTDLPTTPKAFQATLPTSGFQQHAFVTKFSLAQPNASVCLSTNVLYFASIGGSPSSPSPLTIKNCGTLALNVSSSVISNPAFTGNFAACKTIAAGASCTVSMRYTPLAGSSYDTGTVLLTDNAPIPTQTVTLSGSVERPDINVSPYYGIGFGDGVVGVTGGPVTFTIYTTVGLPLHITSVATTGPFSASSNCPKALLPSQTCTLTMTFTPTAVGPAIGTVLVYDDAPNSPQSMQLSGNGLATYPAPSITYLYPSSVSVGSGPVVTQIQGNDFFPNTTILINGSPFTGVMQRFAYGVQLTLPGTLFKKLGDISIQAVNPAPGGASAPVTLSVYRQTPLAAADAIYEPFTQKFYATMAATSATNPNTLVTIDPNTGALGTPIPIGNDPGALGISDDGQTLYVGLNGDHSVVPFNLLTQTPGTAVSLGSDPLKAPLNALDIQVQPGQPGNAVITLGAAGYYYGDDGVALISSGKLKSVFLNEPPNNVAVGGTRFFDNTNLYGWDTSFQSVGMLHFKITGNTLLEAAGFPASYGLGPFASDRTNLYDVNGQVFNATSGSLLTTMNVDTNTVAALRDPSSGRLFFVGDSRQVFDPASFTQISRGGGPQAWTSRFMKWGADGLAYLTPNGTNTYDLVQVRSNAFYSSAGPNPLPAITSLTPATVAAKGGNFVLTVRGGRFEPGAIVQWNGSPRTTVLMNPYTLTVDIPASDITAAGKAQVTVLNPAPGGGKSTAAVETIQ